MPRLNNNKDGRDHDTPVQDGRENGRFRGKPYLRVYPLRPPTPRRPDNYDDVRPSGCKDLASLEKKGRGRFGVKGMKV
jgi:hypothetical protein